MKNFLLSAAFLVFELILMVLLYAAIAWALNTFIFDLFDWFNRQNIILKILLLFIGGTALIYFILGVVQAVFLLLTQPIFNRLPINSFTSIVAFMAFLINTIFLIYDSRNVVESYSFWVVLELLMLSGIIISLNWSILANRRKANLQ